MKAGLPLLKVDGMRSALERHGPAALTDRSHMAKDFVDLIFKEEQDAIAQKRSADRIRQQPAFLID